jgi:hypothetical protein
MIPENEVVPTKQVGASRQRSKQTDVYHEKNTDVVLLLFSHSP